MNTKDLIEEDFDFMLFKGEPKTGKSCAAASFPEPYVMDIDRRIKSVGSYWAEKGIEYDQFNSFIRIKMKLDELRNNCPFKTIIFDGCTAFAESIINEMINSRPVNINTTRAGVRMTEIEDFGAEQRAFDTIFDLLALISREQRVNVIVTAHVIEVEKSVRVGVTVKSRSMLTAGKKVAAFLPIRFNEVYHFQVTQPIVSTDSSQFEVITRHTGEDWACTTYKNLPSIVNITNENFYEKWLRLKLGL